MWSMKKEGMKESREMYLKAIYQLSKIHSGKVRNTDIANHLNVTRPSVTRAVSRLNKENYAMTDENGIVQLTKEGEIEAKRISDRYHTIVEYLKKNLDVEEAFIYADACQMEHIISEELYRAMQLNLENSNKKHYFE